ncbi:hypothetical protein K6W06_04235 [Streptococcus agalactiae]|nr:hypothetical protein [Streptococcus agalactiae]
MTSIGTVGIEPTHIIRPSTIQLSRRYLYRFPITVHVPNGLEELRPLTKCSSIDPSRIERD